MNPIAALKDIHRDCTEIGLETFGRRGEDLMETTIAAKYRRSQRMVREMAKKVAALVSQYESTPTK